MGGYQGTRLAGILTSWEATIYGQHRKNKGQTREMDIVNGGLEKYLKGKLRKLSY